MLAGATIDEGLLLSEPRRFQHPQLPRRSRLIDGTNAAHRVADAAEWAADGLLPSEPRRSNGSGPIPLQLQLPHTHSRHFGGTSEAATSHQEAARRIADGPSLKGARRSKSSGTIPRQPQPPPPQLQLPHTHSRHFGGTSEAATSHQEAARRIADGPSLKGARRSKSSGTIPRQPQPPPPQQQLPHTHSHHVVYVVDGTSETPPSHQKATRRIADGPPLNGARRSKSSGTIPRQPQPPPQQNCPTCCATGGPGYLCADWCHEGARIMRPTQQRVRSQTQSRTTTNAVQRAKMRAKRRAKMLAGARWQAMTGDEREAATLASAKRDHAVHEHGGDHHRGRCKPPLSTAAQSTTEPADQTGLPGWVGWNDPATQRHWPRPQPAVPPTQPQYPGAEGVEPHGQQAAVASAEPHAADTQRSALHRAMTVEAQHYTAAAGGHQVAIAEELGHIDEDQVPHGQQAAAASAKPHAADTQRSAPAQPQSVDHHHGAVVVEAQHYTAATGEHQVTAAEELNHIDIDEEHVLQAIARIRAGEIQSTAPWDRRHLSEWGNTELASFLREGQWKLLKAAARACWNRANGGLRHHTKDFEACLDCFRGAVDEASETGDEEGIEEQQRLLDDLIAHVLVEAEQGATEEGPTAAQHTTAKTRSTAEVQSQPAEGHIEGHIAAEAQQARCGITATVGHAAHAARSLTADETHHGSEGVTSEAIQDHATDETHRDAMGFGVDGDCSEGVTGEAAQDHATDEAHCGSGDSDVGGPPLADTAPVYTCVDCKWPHPASSFSETQLRRARRELSCRCRGCASVKHARHRASQQVAASQNPYHVPGRQCAVCGETFASRNKLFAHLRGSGHGATTQPRRHADGATEADADSGAAEPIHAADAPDRPRQGGQTIGAAAADRKGNAQLFHVPYISPQQASDAHHAAGTQRSATAQSQHHAAGTQRSATAQSQFTDAHSYTAATKAELYLPVLRWLQQRSATGLAQPTEAEIQNWCHSWLRQRDSRAQPPLAKGPEPPGQHHAATNRPRQPQPAKGQGRATEMQRDAVAYAENKCRTAAAGVQHNTEARHQAAAQLPANEAEARHARTADGDGGEFNGPQSPSERRGHGQQQSYQNGGVNQVMQQAPAQMTKLAESEAEMASENAKLNSQVRELRVQLEGLEDTKAALGTVRAVLNEERSKRQKAENEVRHAKQQLDSLQQKFLGVLREKDNETEKRMLALESKFAQAKKGAKKLLKDQEEARRQEVREMEDRFRRQLEVPRQKQKRLEEEIKRLQLQLTEMMKGASSARKTFKTMEQEAMILQQEKKLLGGKTAEATSQIQGMQDAVTTAEKSKQMGGLDSTMELWIQQLENEVQFVRSSLDTEAQVDLEDALNQAVAAQQELENHAKNEREETLAENTAEPNEPRQQVAAAAAEASQVDLEGQVEELDAHLQELRTQLFKAREQNVIDHSVSDATQLTLQQVQVDLQRERADRKERKTECHQSARGSQRDAMDAVQATITEMEAQKNAEISRLERELHMGHIQLSETQKSMVQLRAQLSGAVSGHKKRLTTSSVPTPPTPETSSSGGALTPPAAPTLDSGGATGQLAANGNHDKGLCGGGKRKHGPSCAHQFCDMHAVDARNGLYLCTDCDKYAGAYAMEDTYNWRSSEETLFGEFYDLWPSYWDVYGDHAPPGGRPGYRWPLINGEARRATPQEYAELYQQRLSELLEEHRAKDCACPGCSQYEGSETGLPDSDDPYGDDPYGDRDTQPPPKSPRRKTSKKSKKSRGKKSSRKSKKRRKRREAGESAAAGGASEDERSTGEGIAGLGKGEVAADDDEKEAAAAAQTEAGTEAAVEACRDPTTQQLTTQPDARREEALTRAYRDAAKEQGKALAALQIQHRAEIKEFNTLTHNSSEEATAKANQEAEAAHTAAVADPTAERLKAHVHKTTNAKNAQWTAADEAPASRKQRCEDAADHPRQRGAHSTTRTATANEKSKRPPPHCHLADARRSERRQQPLRRSHVAASRGPISGTTADHQHGGAQPRCRE